jgi:hypothetical protein
MNLLTEVCHGRLHDILPKEYSGTLPELPWGTIKEMHTNNTGQSDIETHTTNILNESIFTARRYILSKGFFTTLWP